MVSTVKRFIAGAVCPRCAAMDRIVMYRNEEGQFRECVSCGYQDKQADPEPGAAELDTRVNTRDNRDDHTVKQVVFFKSDSD